MDICVMLVDPDPTALAASSSILATAGFNVVARVSTELAAVEAAAAMKPDVVVLDMDIPGSGAPALAHRIRQVVDHRVEIVALASFSQAGRLGEMVAAGAAAYVVKGKPAELVGAIRAVRSGTGLLSAEASRPVLEEVQNLYQRERARNIELERTVAQLQTLSVTDWLTGLKNHGYFFDRFAEELERSRRYERSLAIVVADLDGFRKINDTHGHATGDSVLRAVGEVFRRETREVDVACRLGGEEFGVVMPETDVRGGLQAGERLRQATAEAAIPGVGPVTVSIGVAVYPDHAADRDELVDLANAALRRAKTSGKNRVEAVDSANMTPRRSPAGGPGAATGALLEALRVRSASLAEHSERVGELVVALGVRLGVEGSRLEDLKAAALLHDVGRLSLPDSVLAGAGPLGEAEWKLIRQHPRAAYQMLERSVAPEVAQTVLWHHEHLDGTGYPDGLGAADIPDLARIVLVCDAFDAMTSARPYRAPLSGPAALGELEANAGSLFDAEVVHEFARMLRREGTVVEMPIARAG